MTRRNSSFQTPVRCFVAVRPNDRFTITGLAGTFLKIGLANLLVRSLFSLAALLLLLICLAVLYLAS